MTRFTRAVHLDGIPTRLWLQSLVLFAVVTTMILSSIGTGVLLRNSVQAKAQRASQLKLAQLLVECTTAPAQRRPPVKPKPSDCYVRQQSSTSSLVGEPAGPINTVAVAAAACGAAHPGDVPATLACTRAALPKQ